MKYEMKDLGYPRTPTDALYRVEMPDGSKWDVPVQCIADSRDDNYSDDKEDTIGSIRDGGLLDSEIDDWAMNNINWDDVKAYAVQAPIASGPRNVNFEEGWRNGDKKIIGAI